MKIYNFNVRINVKISDNTIIVTLSINKELLEKVDKPNYEVELSETEQKVYNCISKNENITISELSDKVSIGDRQVMRVLNSLKDKNIIRREGSNKNGVWKIIKI
ncbi:MAG: winged helix-turn-helix transcriptional regulator [Clostridia bacterium]|nr:winged helix-turn-helix transcriptional regulator [Clostridia bacterium]